MKLAIYFRNRIEKSQDCW